jgi:hypothetical protein
MVYETQKVRDFIGGADELGPAPVAVLEKLSWADIDRP